MKRILIIALATLVGCSDSGSGDDPRLSKVNYTHPAGYAGPPVLDAWYRREWPYGHPMGLTAEEWRGTFSEQEWREYLAAVLGEGHAPSGDG